MRLLSAMVFAALLLQSRSTQANEQRTLDPGQAIAAVIAQDRQVAGIAYRLAIANRDLCPRVVPLPGFTVHASTQYAPEYRAHFEALTGERDGIVVEAVVEGAPAQAAGLEPGDVILAANGAASPNAPSSTADYTQVKAARALIDDGLRKGTLELRVRRGSDVHAIAFSGETGCDILVQVTDGNSWQASTDGSVISVDSAIVAGAGSASEVAVVIAHELAHILFGDPQARGSTTRELRADSVGLYLMARSGYDPHAGAAFWRRYDREAPRQARRSSPRLNPARRAKNALVTAASIDRARAFGAELWPAVYEKPKRRR